MKVHLMYQDHDFHLDDQFPFNHVDLVQDLELEVLFKAMASNDKLLYRVARHGLLCSLTDEATIHFRQEILQDCVTNESVVRELYDIAAQTIENRQRSYFGVFMRYPSSILYDSVKLLEMLMGMLKRLRRVADDHGDDFRSEGIRCFFAMLHDELSDAYFEEITDHLTMLGSRNGVLISAELGKGSQGVNYTLRQQTGKKRGLIQKLLHRRQDEFTFRISDRDESGARALGELRDRGINEVANALAQSADHILGFFRQLQAELAFYVGCLNLHRELSEVGGVLCMPIPLPIEEQNYSFAELYDPCLRLSREGTVYGNSLHALDTNLVVITGANQGGKSTFLRSLGSAQLMMQAGMFVAAEDFKANICTSIFSHFKREEDATMKSGKFDEELSRMNEIAHHIHAHALVLFNESFAATNESEGSEIARQVTCALVDSGVKVCFVTHLYQFAKVLYGASQYSSVFLRASRQSDGTRTFQIEPGPPSPTSHGKDLYEAIFGQSL